MPKKIENEKIKLSIPLSYTKTHNTITIVFSTPDDEETVTVEPQSTDTTSGLYQ